MKHRIYIVSSWRNEHYPEVVAKLRGAGHDVYDFRNPPSGDSCFKWSSVSEDYMEWSPQQYRDMLHHPKAERQFHNDIEAMEACDVCMCWCCHAAEVLTQKPAGLPAKDVPPSPIYQNDRNRS